MFSRRTFLLASLAAAGAAGRWARAGSGAGPLLLGVCRPWTDGELLKTLGFDYAEENVRKLLVPNQPDGVFDKTAEAFASATLPVRSCNGFFPGEMKLVGPAADHDKAVAWADTAARRAARLRIPLLVLGSGEARRVPDDFPRAKAEAQFVSLCRRLGERAQAHGVTIAIESLNRRETNFMNTLAEVIDLVDAVNHPAFQAVADFYHIAREEEGPDVVRRAGTRIRHCHLAEKEKRTAPGTAGDDFRPYFKALKKTGYSGGISLECGWKNFKTQAPQAVEVMRRQWAEA